MPTPQGGIIPAPSPNALFLVLRVLEPGKNGKAVSKVAAGMPALIEKVGAADPRAKLVCTVSFGSEFWNTISPGKRPAGLRPFTAIEADGRRAPSTGGDVLSRNDTISTSNLPCRFVRSWDRVSKSWMKSTGFNISILEI